MHCGPEGMFVLLCTFLSDLSKILWKRSQQIIERYESRGFDAVETTFGWRTLTDVYRLTDVRVGCQIWVEFCRTAGGFTEGAVRACTLHIAHCTLHIAHCTLHIAHCTLNISHCTLHTEHCTLHTAHCTLHTAHCTLYIAHCTLHIAHCTLHTAVINVLLRSFLFYCVVFTLFYIIISANIVTVTGWHTLPFAVISCWRSLDQCFSTFVRPQPGKFFFYKTRARS